MEHEIIQSGEIHVPHNWKFANQAARLAAVITDSSQLDKIALQSSDSSYWRLSGVNPATWVAIMGPAGQSFTVDAVGPFSERSTYDSQPAGFSFLSTTDGMLYIRETAVSGVWSEGIPFGKGEDGTPGVGVPEGGLTGQTLQKLSEDDYDTAWQSLNKSSVGLGNVDNTSDLDKPISTLTQEALDEKQDAEAGKGLSTNDFDTPSRDKLSSLKPIQAGTNLSFDETTSPGTIIINASGGGGSGTVQTVNSIGPDGAGNVQIAKSDIGLGNVDNTSDLNKPISTATQVALDNKQNTEVGKGLSTNDFTTPDKTKLDGIQSGATANDTDANLKNRANHTGSQAISTVTGLQTALDGKEPAITLGTTAQYITGAKTLVDFATSVRTAVLTGLSTATSTVVTAADTVVQAIGKLQAQISLRALSGLITSSGLTMTTAKLLGRSTAGSGAVEEITIGNGLALTSGVLSSAAGEAVGTISAWNGLRSAIQAGKIPVDGQEENHATYPDLKAALDAGIYPTIDEATWQSDPTQRAKFVIVSSTGKMRMPDWNGKSEGSLGAVTIRGDGSLSFGETGRIQRDQFQGFRLGTVKYGSTVASDSVAEGPPTGVSSPTLNLGGSGTGRNTHLTGDFYPDSANGTPRVGTETRMLNVTVVWVVKAFGTVTNPGSVDAAQLASDMSGLNSRVTTIEASRKTFTVQHRVPTNTAGGATAVGSNVRPLNAVVNNDIVGASLNTTTSVITLPAGKYRVIGYSNVYAVSNYQGFLATVATPGTPIAYGSCGFAFNSTGADTGRTEFNGGFTLATTTDIQMRVYTSAARSGDGFGNAINSGIDNVHAALTFEKIA